MSTPKFIVLEGIDGSGTTTQLSRVSAALRTLGHRVHETREPTGGRIGKLIREQLSDPSGVSARCLALLFAADRIDHLDREILPALARGEVVVCDRYVMSSLVYQSLDCNPAWVADINFQALWPDVTFLLDIDHDIAMQRTQNRRAETFEPVERFDAEATQQRLAAGYRKLFAQDLRHCDPETFMFMIDAAEPAEVVTQAILDRCRELGL